MQDGTKKNVKELIFKDDFASMNLLEQFETLIIVMNAQIVNITNSNLVMQKKQDLLYAVFERILSYCVVNSPRILAIDVCKTYGQVAFEFRNFKQCARIFKKLKDHCRNTNNIEA